MAEEVDDEILGFVLKEVNFLENGATDFLGDFLLEVGREEFEFVHFEDFELVFETVFLEAEVHEFESLFVGESVESLDLEVELLFFLVEVPFGDEVEVEDAGEIGHDVAEKYDVSKDDEDDVESAFSRFGRDVPVAHCENHGHRKVHAGDVLLFD